ncbi:MAG TPA: FAD-dependent oxidoreductase [Usitatibacter sp.]|nr:FAD-dependent oxidoreductase [Usitatibacter sp.]
MNHVIIGNGPAGVIAAETLRKADPAAAIRLVGDEPVPPYSRMAIPYLLMGRIGEEGTYLRKEAGHFERSGIELVQGRAASIDAPAGRVKMADGRSLDYDRLLLATGARPVRLDIPGIDLPGVHPCWTLEDARAVMALAKPGARVVQMGAGFIGCIILEALAERGVQLAVVEMGNRMVPRMMTEKAGGLIKRWCEAKGVRVLTSTKVEAIAPSSKGSALSVKLSSGEVLPADLVISATGVRPALELASTAGLTTNVGIRVDKRMRTSDARIYAAGDAAQAEELYTHNYVVNAVQPNAAEQARVAALNMAGRDVQSPGSFALNVLDTLGLIASSFGQWQGVANGEGVEHVDEANYRYVGLQFDDADRLVGATTLGLTEHVGVLRGLIQSGRPLKSWKQALRKDPLELMKAYLATVQAAA